MIAQSVTPSSPVVARMADVITARVAAEGSITREELLLQFSDEEIAAHFAAARKRAQATGKAGRR